MNKNFRLIFAAALALALLSGCQSTAQPMETPQPSTAPPPPADVTPTPVETAPAVEDIQFRLGSYLYENTYFEFYMDGVSGTTADKETGMGVAFMYEVDGNRVVFHMGEPDDNTGATVTEVDSETFHVVWDDGREGDMVYTGYPDFEEDVQFRLGSYLYENTYFEFYMDGVSGTTADKETGMGVAFMYEVDGNRVVFHMGEPDDNTGATVTEVDSETFHVVWDDGREGDMVYVGYPDFEGVQS